MLFVSRDGDGGVLSASSLPPERATSGKIVVFRKVSGVAKVSASDDIRREIVVTEVADDVSGPLAWARGVPRPSC